MSNNTITTNNSVDPFWVNDVSILFQSNRLSQFFPVKNMTMDEVLNSLVRLSLYISIFLFIYKKNINAFFIPVGTMVITYLINKYSIDINQRNQNLNLNATESFTNCEDPMLKPKSCVQSTIENPFGNILLTDYEDAPNREVCDTSDFDQTIFNKHAEENFNFNLYQDVGDIFNKNNSQRQFYRTPIQTIPNKQKEFALWCYNVPKTCKEGNGNQCYANLHHPLKLPDN